MTRYELLDRIGVGGMAEIFRGKAVAAGGFEKPVAIKRILPHLSQDPRFVELLIAEAKVLSLLRHRNIVQIFDVGLGDDGQYFLVMEHVDGRDLGAVQRALEGRRGRVPFDLALHIGAEICEALEHAHTSRGPDGKPMALVHRDVSPSNVLLSRAGEVKLTDFGIAKRADADATQGGVVRGKFAYISPEQARSESLDPRSDVFSVGILLWELVCNRRLFSGLDDLSALRAVREPVVPRPTEIDRSLPPEIDSILSMALARDRARRFASCGQLGQKLRSLRYSLDATTGDPATELAKIVDATEQVERESRTFMAVSPSSAHDEIGEATVIRIQTADAFSSRSNDISQVRSVIDHFEEAQTRLSALTGDQLRMLRERGPQPSIEGTTEKRHRDPDDDGRGGRMADSEDEELTRARPPHELARLAGLAPPSAGATDGYAPALDTPPQAPPTPSDDTRLVAPRARQTPLPMPATQPLSLQETLQQLPPPPQHASIRTPVPHVPRTPHPGALAQAPAYAPPAPAGGYPAWDPRVQPGPPARDATPTAPSGFTPAPFAQRPSMPELAGVSPAPAFLLQPWMLVVGALVMATLAFVITRAVIG